MDQSQLEQLKSLFKILEASQNYTENLLDTKLEGHAYCYGYSIGTIKYTKQLLNSFIEEEEYAIEVEKEKKFIDAYDDGGCGHDQNEAYYESPLERL